MDQIKTIPNHIAIIPDGNRRWAKGKNLPTIEGHKQGLATATKVAKKIRAMGVHTLTVWAFSTENWSRDQTEVNYLLTMYEQFIDQHLKEALADEVRLVYIGRKDRMPNSLVEKLQKVEQETAKFADHILNFALDYGGHDEILRAIKKMSDANIDPATISEDQFANLLDTAGQQYPNPDIILRTSGEMRTSGLLPWQAVYAEYFFLDKYFPDLNEQDIENIIEEFAKRQRRFGA